MHNRVYVKAQEWLVRGNETNSIDAFSNFWRGFNNLYFGLGQGQERDKIRAFIAQNISEKNANELLYSCSSEVAYLLSQPVIDMRGNGKNTSANIDVFNTESNFSAKLQEVFMVIYQVRCNLEHGQKSPSIERDVKLCESAAPLVAALIKDVISHHSSRAPSQPLNLR